MKLATKLALTVTICMALLAAVSVIRVQTSFRPALEKQIISTQANETADVMEKVDRYMNERTLDIQSLSGRIRLQRFLESTHGADVADAEAIKTVQDVMVTYRAIGDNWANYTILNKNKVALATTGTSLGEITTILARPELQVIAEKALSGSVSFSDAFLPASSGSPTVIFAAPIHVSDIDPTVSGILVGQLNWGPISQVVGAVTTGDAHLVNQQNLLIADNKQNNEDELLLKSYADVIGNAAKISKNYTNEGIVSSFIAPALTRSGVESISTRVLQQGEGDYTGSGWTLIIETPTSIAFASVNALAKRLIITTIIGLLLLELLLITALYYFVVRPVRNLRKELNNVTTASLGAEIVPTSKDELGELADSFNHMVHSQRAAYQILQHESETALLNRTRLLTLVNSLSQGFMIVNRDFSVELFNQTVANSFGLEGKGSNLPAKSLLDRFGAANSAALESGIKQCLDTGSAQEFHNMAYNERILHIFMSPVLDNTSTTGVVILIEDVTEEELLQRSKEEFFSIASHELRTPLTGIRGNASLILEYFQEELKNPDLKGMVDDIHNSSVRLIGIVNDFLDASRLEQGKMKFKNESFHIEKIIESVIYELAGVSREKQIYIKFENKFLGSLPEVYGDKDRVKQVLYNLTGNAMKFTDHGGITIWAQTYGDNLKVFVEDSGKGISKIDQELLFRKFQQVGKTLKNETTRGTGLGLYISKLITENMGGKITLESSELGKGTVFSFTIPLAVSQGAMISQTEAAQRLAVPLPAVASAHTQTMQTNVVQS